MQYGVSREFKMLTYNLPHNRDVQLYAMEMKLCDMNGHINFVVLL